MISKRIKQAQRGDTIVEVLLAIAIAAFAIATSYAIANKSLQRGISARERTEALTIAENQISALKLREQAVGDFEKFDNSVFAARADQPPKHFCLDATATDPTASNWQPQTVCNISGGSTTHNVDITAQVTDPSNGKKIQTVYTVSVTWPEIGTGKTNQLIIYYRF